MVDVPVYLSKAKLYVPVEVQIRTTAMDFWASLEHSLRYKAAGHVPDDICEELHEVGKDIAALDEKMQSIHDRIDAIVAEECKSVS